MKYHLSWVSFHVISCKQSSKIDRKLDLKYFISPEVGDRFMQGLMKCTKCSASQVQIFGFYCHMSIQRCIKCTKLVRKLAKFSPLGMSRMKNLIVSALKLYYRDCLCGMDENILNFVLFLLFTVCVKFLTVNQS